MDSSSSGSDIQSSVTATSASTSLQTYSSSSVYSYTTVYTIIEPSIRTRSTFPKTTKNPVLTTSSTKVTPLTTIFTPPPECTALPLNIWMPGHYFRIRDFNVAYNLPETTVSTWNDSLITGVPTAAHNFRFDAWLNDKGQSSSILQRMYNACRPSSVGAAVFSPGFYCPFGYSAISSAITVINAPTGDIRYPETEIVCCASGYSLSSSIFRDFSFGIWYTTLSLCVQLNSTPTPVHIHAIPDTVLPIYTWSTVTGESLRAESYSKYSYQPSPTSAVATVGPRNSSHELLTIWEPPVVLRYRQTDLSISSTQIGEAQVVPDGLPEYILATSTTSAQTELVRSTIIALILAFSFGIILVFIAWLRRKRQRIIRRRTEKWWFLGLSVYFPTMIGIITGVFSVLYASRKEWQEETIRYFGSPNSVRLCVQAMAFIMRTSAVLLAWATVAGIGWLTLVSGNGMRREELLITLDLAATGGSYNAGILAVWHHLRAISIPQAILIFLGLVLASASDLVGVSMVASTGLGHSNVGTIRNLSVVPFMIANRTIVRNEGLPLIDTGSQLSSVAEKYPIILRRAEDNHIAFLPLLGHDGDRFPDTYTGVARFGNFTSMCRPVRINGSINVDLAHNAVSLTGSLIDPPFERLSSLVEQTVAFYTTNGENWYQSGLSEHLRTQKNFLMERKIFQNFFNPRYQEGRTALATVRLERLADQLSLLSNANDPDPTREYFFILEMSVNRTTDFIWNDDADIAWASDVVENQSSGQIPIYSEDTGGTVGDLGLYQQIDRVYEQGEDLFWKTRVCEVELPKQWGIIKAKSIGQSSTPLTELCSESRLSDPNYASLSCPNITSHLSTYSAIPWTQEQTIKNLRTEPVETTEFIYWEKILSYFTSPRIIETSGHGNREMQSVRGKKSFCPEVFQYPETNSTMDGSTFYGSLNPTLYYACNHSAWGKKENYKPGAIKYYEGAVFCYTCPAARRASTSLSSHMIRAAQIDNDRDFEDAFANVMMHLVAGTYYAILPRMNGYGPAVYTNLRPVTLIINAFWIYLAVAYTMFLIVVAWIVQARMRAMLGVDRTGSLLQSAAVLHRSPLSPLLDNYQMLGGNVVAEKGSEDGIEEEEKKLKLGVTASGRYMIGYVDELKQASRRLRESKFYEAIEDQDSPNRLGSDGKFQ